MKVEKDRKIMQCFVKATTIWVDVPAAGHVFCMEMHKNPRLYGWILPCNQPGKAKNA